MTHTPSQVANLQLFYAERLPVDTMDELAEHVGCQPKEALACVRSPQNLRRDNGIRAGWGARALLAYAGHVDTTGEDFEEIMSDMLADVRHLADALDLNWDAVEWTMQRSYQSEITGDL